MTDVEDNLFSISLLIIWVIITLIQWFDPYPDAHMTLVHVLRDQWNWVRDLMHRIY